MTLGRNPPAVDDAATALVDDRKLGARDDRLTYTVSCSECAQVLQRSRRATRYGYALLCRSCEIDAE